jgi:hypothetical protein
MGVTGFCRAMRFVQTDNRKPVQRSRKNEQSSHYTRLQSVQAGGTGKKTFFVKLLNANIERYRHVLSRRHRKKQDPKQRETLLFSFQIKFQQTLKNMNKLVNIISVSFFVFSTIQLSAQRFHEDGSMVLTEISKDKKYGYQSSHKTAIKVGKVENGYAFLSALLGPNGEPVRFQRLGSCCRFKSETADFGYGFLDEYEVYYQGLDRPMVLYINGYEYETPQCPVGFTFKTTDIIEKPTIIPQENLLQVSFCDGKNVCSVDREFLLKEKVGELPLAGTNPEFEGGIEALESYFADNPLTDDKAKELVFRVSIGFVVNCKGEAGNFQILTRGKGELETFANQVLERVNNMPQNWKPATKNGKTVDCYQVLSFTVVGGQLDKTVSYR